jgi:hypothetical protein
VVSRVQVARRFVLGFLVAGCGALGGLMFVGAPALAAAPEVPSVVTVESIKASSATFHGMLNPGKQGSADTYELGTYEFLYKKGSLTCTGEGRAPESLGRGPESPGISLGRGEEELPAQEVTDLESGTEYTVCLLARNGGHGEETIGPEAHFTTAIPVEAPEGLKVKEPIGATTATLEGVLNPNDKGEVGSYEFAYRQSATECQRENSKTHQQENEKATSNESSAGGKGEAAKPAQISKLLPHVQYTFCLVAHNNAGETSVSSPKTFTTGTESPSVAGTSVSHIGSAGATVEGQIEPGGLETAYSVQYGTSTAYESQTTPVSISPSTSSATVAVTVPLSKLLSNTAYHLRLVVTNTDGKALGTDVTFTTYPTGTSGLPDDRVYEMVSLPENYNADVMEGESDPLPGALSTHQPFQASANGDAVMFMSQPTIGGNGEGNTGSGGDENRATRSPQGGWTQVNLVPPGRANEQVVFEGFSSDLSVGFIAASSEPPFVTTEALTEPGLVAGRDESASYSVPYALTFSEGLYRPLFTTTPPNRSYTGAIGPNGAEENERFEAHHVLSNGGANAGSNTAYAGSSANAEDQLFEANDALLEGEGELEKELSSDVKREVEVAKEARKLDEEVVKLDNEGNEEWRIKRKEAFALEAFDARNELYVSVDSRPSLVNVLPDGKVAAGATFGGPPLGEPVHKEPDFDRVISASGSRIFWTSLEYVSANERGEEYFAEVPKAIYVREDGTRTVQVSPGSAQFWTASAEGRYAFYTEAGKLYRFDVESEAREEIAGGEAGVQGVIGTNETGEEGAYVYFVATEALTSGKNAEGHEPVRGADNLYASEPDPGNPVQHLTRFIGTLSSADSNDWAVGMGERSAEVAPDGRGLVFETTENLTGHSYSGEGSPEVYTYQAEAGSVFCASCRPQASGGILPDSRREDYTYRWISEDGSRVFFDSEASLVARDVNGVRDVYEWERDGAGECHEAEGCVYLISGGVEGAASFIDASSSGNDVFFISRQRLVPEAQNELTHLYDARVEGALPVAAPACTGTGCQGVPAPPPIFATPASVTFSGVGNFPPSAPPPPPKTIKKTVKCSKGKTRNEKGKCVKAKKKKKMKAKKSAHIDGRASR